MNIIIHQILCEKSDWPRAFSQFTIYSLWTWHDKYNICCRYCIYHVKFKVCLVTKPLGVFSPQKQNGWTLRFCFWGWIMWKMYNKTIIEFGFHMISWIIKTSCLCYLPQPSASADNTDLGFDNSWYHAQPHPIIVYYQNRGLCYLNWFSECCRPIRVFIVSLMYNKKYNFWDRPVAHLEHILYIGKIWDGPGKSKIPDRLGFSRHMKTRL